MTDNDHHIIGHPLVAEQIMTDDTKDENMDRRRNGFLSFLFPRQRRRVAANDDVVDATVGAYISIVPASESLESSERSTSSLRWKSSGKTCHRQPPLSPGAAADTTPPTSGEISLDASSSAGDDPTELGVIMARAHRIPGTWYYSNNHIMINQERTRRSIPPLVRDLELDGLAREQAFYMAQKGRPEHSDPSALQSKLKKPCCWLGENVAEGTSIRTIQEEMMRCRSKKANILGRRYTSMGIGSAKGPDGTLFLCQIFRG